MGKFPNQEIVALSSDYL